MVRNTPRLSFKTTVTIVNTGALKPPVPLDRLTEIISIFFAFRTKSLRRAHSARNFQSPGIIPVNSVGNKKPRHLKTLLYTPASPNEA